MKILFLSRWFPYPPDNGSKIRILNVVKQLARRHDVALLAFAEATDPVDARTLLALREYCSRVRVVPYRSFHPRSARAALGFLSPRPRWLVDTQSDSMRAAVAREFGAQHADLVVASQLAMVPYAVALRGAPALMEELEISAFHDAVGPREPVARRLRSLLTWFKLGAYLRNVLPRFRACTVASDLEKRRLQLVAPRYGDVAVIPNAVDLTGYAGDFGAARPNTLVFSGALTYAANYDAASHFLSRIHPLIQDAVPEVVLRVTGAHTGVDLSSLPSRRGVLYTGYVADIRPVIGRSWVSVVPLRRGGGTRLKIVESLALGTPVVSTSKGAEGLDVTDGVDILLADDPRAFADRVVELLRSPELRCRLAANGRRLVESKYDWQIVGQDLRTLVDRITPFGPG
ncbi:MAG TPA: glycosyltransferase family 4 protein [Chloroflexota bacterium]|nr:glycosyltransferase family 4 protein [Chloroflexota bacterium]